MTSAPGHRRRWGRVLAWLGLPAVGLIAAMAYGWSTHARAMAHLRAELARHEIRDYIVLPSNQDEVPVVLRPLAHALRGLHLEEDPSYRSQGDFAERATQVVDRLLVIMVEQVLARELAQGPLPSPVRWGVEGHALLHGLADIVALGLNTHDPSVIPLAERVIAWSVLAGELNTAYCLHSDCHWVLLGMRAAGAMPQPWQTWEARLDRQDFVLEEQRAAFVEYLLQDAPSIRVYLAKADTLLPWPGRISVKEWLQGPDRLAEALERMRSLVTSPWSFAPAQRQGRQGADERPSLLRLVQGWCGIDRRPDTARASFLAGMEKQAEWMQHGARDTDLRERAFAVLRWVLARYRTAHVLPSTADGVANILTLLHPSEPSRLPLQYLVRGSTVVVVQWNSWCHDYPRLSRAMQWKWCTIQVDVAQRDLVP